GRQRSQQRAVAPPVLMPRSAAAPLSVPLTRIVQLLPSRATGCAPSHSRAGTGEILARPGRGRGSGGDAGPGGLAETALDLGSDVLRVDQEAQLVDDRLLAALDLQADGGVARVGAQGPLELADDLRVDAVLRQHEDDGGHAAVL